MIRIRPYYLPPAVDIAVIDGHEFPIPHGGTRTTARDGHAQGGGEAARNASPPTST